MIENRPIRKYFKKMNGIFKTVMAPIARYFNIFIIFASLIFYISGLGYI